MSTTRSVTDKMTNYRWTICAMLFFATTVNYLDRQVLSLTWYDFIAPEFHWTNTDYGNITTFFSGFYALCMLFAGRFVDWIDTKKGFLWSIGIWSLGACMHAFCGIATSGIVAGEWLVGFDGAKEAIAKAGSVGMIVNVSVMLFIFSRAVLALGESGNFPAAIKATAEYFPKKDRGFSTSVFNSGAQIGALLAPLSIPVIAAKWGWEMSFLIIGAMGFIWMGFWVFIYKKPEENPHVNKAELDYILQDDAAPAAVETTETRKPEKKPSFIQCFKYKQTWAFAFGKFMTDGVWWFYLFWAPAYLSSVYDMPSSDPKAQIAIFVLYLISMISLFGGYLPTIFIEKKGMNPYAGRMRAMLIFALFPLLALFAQPLGHVSYWIPIIIIGIAGAAHQAWSANIFSTIGDMFPKSAIATVTGIGGMAGGVGSMIINQGSGRLFDYTEASQMSFLGYTGIEAGYFIIFCVCAIAYIIGWIVMKLLVPKFKPIVVE
ncbi:MAG: MFS transporter [Prevotellaceae bacterium]|nr:MFS transporter [Prevotellaceae bacterium]